MRDMGTAVAGVQQQERWGWGPEAGVNAEGDPYQGQAGVNSQNWSRTVVSSLAPAAPAAAPAALRLGVAMRVGEGG